MHAQIADGETLLRLIIDALYRVTRKTLSDGKISTTQWSPPLEKPTALRHNVERVCQLCGEFKNDRKLFEPSARSEIGGTHPTHGCFPTNPGLKGMRSACPSRPPTNSPSIFETCVNAIGARRQEIAR